MLPALSWLSSSVVCKLVPALQTLLERPGVYCSPEADAAAAQSEFKHETKMPADSATLT